MFFIRRLYLIVDGSMNKVINVFVSTLALNHLLMHNKCMRVHCPTIFVWCSLLLLVAITAINVCVVHANYSCRCLQTHEIAVKSIASRFSHF